MYPESAVPVRVPLEMRSMSNAQRERVSDVLWDEAFSAHEDREYYGERLPRDLTDERYQDLYVGRGCNRRTPAARGCE